jgi:lipopolysaccharide/colanic/teichoic acid biosynthesis glycosyltransferase
MSIQPQPSAPRPWPSVPDQAARRVHIMEEELFRAMLLRERRRADRTQQPFVLVLLEVRGRTGLAAAAVWKIAVASLLAVKQDTDVLGWFRSGTVIGLLRPETALGDHRAGLESRIRREVDERVEPRARGTVSIRVHGHPEPGSAGVPRLRSLDALLATEVRWRHQRTTMYDVMKRGLDVVGSLILLAILSVLFLAIAVAVRLTSRGPVLFGQVRIGQMLKPFTMLKFRTMYAQADASLHHEFVTRFIKTSGQAGSSPDDGIFKLTNDPRVTRVGRILRKTSLDELPQLLNVLRGDMSLVGPRPPLPYEFEQYQPWHRRRVLEARPGITGLWQVTGRSRTTFDDMVRLDLRYAQTRSLWTDIKILLATPVAVISGKGAC